MVLGQTLWLWCQMCSMRILMTECCSIIFLNGLDMDVPSHHTLLILTHVINSLGTFWMIQFTKATCRLLKNWNKKFRHKWSVSVKKLCLQVREIFYASCRWSWMLIVHILKYVSMIITLPRLPNSDTKYSDVWYVVWKLEDTKTRMPFQKDPDLKPPLYPPTYNQTLSVKLWQILWSTYTYWTQYKPEVNWTTQT